LESNRARRRLRHAGVVARRVTLDRRKRRSGLVVSDLQSTQPRSLPRVKPYFGHCADWVYADPMYRALSSGERFVLHIVVGQCDQTLPDQSRRGCWGGGRLWALAGGSEATFRRHISKLEQYGFIVKVSQGGGFNKANEYATPGVRGALDDLAVGEDERFRRRRKTIAKRDGQPSQNAMQARGETQRTASQNSIQSSSKILDHSSRDREDKGTPQFDLGRHSISSNEEHAAGSDDDQPQQNEPDSLDQSPCVMSIAAARQAIQSVRGPGDSELAAPIAEEIVLHPRMREQLPVWIQGAAKAMNPPGYLNRCYQTALRASNRQAASDRSEARKVRATERIETQHDADSFVGQMTDQEIENCCGQVAVSDDPWAFEFTGLQAKHVRLVGPVGAQRRLAIYRLCAKDDSDQSP
jgi:hypothetical protein